MSASLVDGLIYRDDDWPHGLRCGQCRREFREPDRFSERLDGFAEDVPLLQLVCLSCATSEEPSALSS